MLCRPSHEFMAREISAARAQRDKARLHATLCRGPSNAEFHAFPQWADLEFMDVCLNGRYES